MKGEPQGSPRTPPAGSGGADWESWACCGSAILALSPAGRASTGRLRAARRWRKSRKPGRAHPANRADAVMRLVNGSVRIQD